MRKSSSGKGKKSKGKKNRMARNWKLGKKDEHALRGNKVGGHSLRSGEGPLETGDYPGGRKIKMPKVPVYNKQFFKSAKD